MANNTFANERVFRIPPLKCLIKLNAFWPIPISRVPECSAIALRAHYKTGTLFEFFVSRNDISYIYIYCYRRKDLAGGNEVRYQNHERDVINISDSENGNTFSLSDSGPKSISERTTFQRSMKMQNRGIINASPCTTDSLLRSAAAGNKTFTKRQNRSQISFLIENILPDNEGRI